MPGQITGLITNCLTGLPIKGARVFIFEYNTDRLISDGSGSYASSSLPRGVYRIQAMMAGYQPSPVQDVQVFDGQVTVYDFELAPLHLTSNLFGNNLPFSAFHQVKVAGLTSEAGWTFYYNVNTDLVKVTTAGGGSVSQSNSKGVLQTGAQAGSSAKIETRKHSRYIPGLGLLVNATAVFTAGVSEAPRSSVWGMILTACFLVITGPRSV